MLRALTKIKNLAFNRQCVHFVPQLRFLGEESPACPFDTVLKHKTDELKQLNLKEDHNTTSILKALKTAKVFNISASGELTNKESLVQGVAVSDVTFDEYSVQPSTIYCRCFYPTLLNHLLEKKHSILTGNPGISKSWFHWYILYHMVNENVVRNFKVPKLIIRQIGQRKLVFIFPHCSKVFRTLSVNVGHELFADIQPDAALFLIEPEDSLTEPVFTNIPTILTCSPDRRRYHEFEKKGAVKVYMPVWELDELQLVGAHICRHTNNEFHKKVLTSEEIASRYYRFGGIARHVIPVHEGALTSAERMQEQVLVHAKAVDTFIKGTDIEKVDDQKDNISHMLLHYKVFCENGDFARFKMVFASEYVQKRMEEQTPSDEELHDSIHELKHMFRGGKKEKYELFEYVVYHCLSRLEWKIYHKLKQEWIDRKFEFEDCYVVAKQEEKVLKSMRSSVLYRPLNPHFPLIDMLWVELNEQRQKEFFAVQVTFADRYDNSMSVYQNLREYLELKPEDKLNIYFVSNPRYVETYAKHDKASFISGATIRKKKDPCKFKKELDKLNIEFACIKAKEFDYPFMKGV